MRSRYRIVAGVVAVLAVAQFHPPASATSPEESFTLSRSAPEVTWAGMVADSVVADPEACALPASGCASWNIKVDASWNPDRLVVAIDNRETEVGWDFSYDLNLALYSPDGDLMAYAASPFEGQVIAIDKPASGTYKAVAVPRFVVGTLPFNGYAALVKGPAKANAQRPPRDLLPNLVAEPPTDIQIAAPPISLFAPFFWEWRGVRGPHSCYPQERVEQKAERCLRFSQTVSNRGDGPLVLRLNDLIAGTMVQRIDRTDGSSRDEVVGDVAFHAAHGHFHYQGWAETRLYEEAPNGTRGALVKTGRKQGFCMADVRNVWFGQPQQVPPRYVDPRACDGNEEMTGSQVGISTGWADTYPWFLGDQFIEISGIPDGRYYLEFRVNDSQNGVFETTDADNEAWSLIEINGNEVVTLKTSDNHGRRT